MPDILTELDQDFIDTTLSHQLSQFRYSPNLTALITLLLSPYATLQHTLKQMLLERHIDTAIGKQLDGVGDIVGMPRPFTKMNGEWYFGFTGQSKAKPFSQAPIRDLALQTTSKQVSYMPDDTYRRLIKWKVVANNSHGTVEDVIEACKALFLAEQVHIQEKNDAEIKISITRAIKNKFDAIEDSPNQWIPAAAGVKIFVEFIDQ
ncbi:DUF2612 domain-containing protein [Gallibacterium salpingitidis]|uniref:Uncharacterized protein n=1 Tax=Gallibacterium salpingitidis TaxID=505341 RepID=A0A1A7NTY7_9PAST|nr:DUF2612 domain-containing protein [Gallibacterium salpingitidis]OBW92971.1 hypothetical protein QS62_07840 [Gallibacterium salpingitidis]